MIRIILLEIIRMEMILLKLGTIKKKIALDMCFPDGSAVKNPSVTQET